MMSNDELETRLTNDLRHTLKLVPQSQRELFVSELVPYFTKFSLQVRIDELDGLHRTDLTLNQKVVTEPTIEKRKAELTAIKDSHFVPGHKMESKESE